MRIGFALVLLIAAVARADDPLDQVNTLQGTDSNIGLSHGGTLPLVATPWGMTNWAPQTNGGWGWWFQPNAKQVRGIRATHQPSPWMGDYGQLLLMPQTGPALTGPEARQSPYDPAVATFRPDYIHLDLPRYDVGVEVTATDRCGVLRMTFRSGDVGRLIVDPAEPGHVEQAGKRSLRGWTTFASGWTTPPKFKAYFVVQFDRDLTKFESFAGPNRDFDKPAEHVGSTSGYAEFATDDGRRAVTARVGTSYISFEQAERNLATEAAGDFDAVRAATRAKWEASLGRIEVAGGTADQRRTFYSCLYRAQLFPHRNYELDEQGKPIHYSPYDGAVHPGHLYTDNGFWDVYRTCYPFWSIAYPDQLGEILDGFVNAYHENGWFPQWPSPGDRSGMIGTHVDAVVADAVAKHIGGFDVDAAYAGIRRDAFDLPTRGSVGRPGLKGYLAKGYVPAERDDYSASATLDYAYDDWCVAQVAQAIGKSDDHAVLLKRSQSYRSSWDPATGFFRPRRADGSWAFDPFDEFAWGSGYVEGGPWQCGWAVQHDVAGMAELMGGKRAMAERLDRLLGQPPVFHKGTFGGTIHEMTEMARANFGQYDHGNQPSHHVLYLYAAIGEPWKTQYWTRRVCADLYGPGPDGFPGDEDNGEMASWFLLSSTGLYPLCVGDPNYTLTSPLFDRVAIHRPNGKTFAFTATHNDGHNVYVLRRTLNGQPYTATTLPHAALVAGGELAVTLSPQAQTAAP